MQRKKYCSCESDFKRFYHNQAGSGFSDIELYRGSPYQRGYGFGSLFKRFSIPILKYIGKQAIRTGVGVGQDILDKKNFKESLKARGQEGLKKTARDATEKIGKMVGSGIRKKAYKKSKKKIKKKKDIFG